jgi:hypothetical protein
MVVFPRTDSAPRAVTNTEPVTPGRDVPTVSITRISTNDTCPSTKTPSTDSILVVLPEQPQPTNLNTEQSAIGEKSIKAPELAVTNPVIPPPRQTSRFPVTPTVAMIRPSPDVSPDDVSSIFLTELPVRPPPKRSFFARFLDRFEHRCIPQCNHTCCNGIPRTQREDSWSCLDNVPDNYPRILWFFRPF